MWRFKSFFLVQVFVIPSSLQNPHKYAAFGLVWALLQPGVAAAWDVDGELVDRSSHLAVASAEDVLSAAQVDAAVVS
jgi:hypothetical protein